MPCRFLNRWSRLHYTVSAMRLKAISDCLSVVRRMQLQVLWYT